MPVTAVTPDDLTVTATALQRVGAALGDLPAAGAGPGAAATGGPELVAAVADLLGAWRWRCAVLADDARALGDLLAAVAALYADAELLVLESVRPAAAGPRTSGPAQR